MKNSSNMKNSRSPKVRNLSAIIAIVLAGVTLFQAGTVKSNDLNKEVSIMEAELLAEIDQFFADDELTLEEELYMEIEEEDVEKVSVFDSNDNLISSGIPTSNNELRMLVNQADFLSQFGNKKYYRVSL